MSEGATIRERRIIEALHDGGIVGVEKLARMLSVSTMTIRRDLARLESGGRLVRTHGGAIATAASEAMFSFEGRLHENRRRKERICAAAAKLVAPGEVIFIDCGTTLFRLARFIRSLAGLRVITNSLPVLSELSVEPRIRVTLTGGDLVHERKALYGRVAEEMIASVHADKAFIGADGVSAADGLSSFDEQEAGISLRMAESADRVFLLCDSSKIGRTSYYRFAPLCLVDAVVTDDGRAANELSAAGVEVIEA